MAAPAYALLHDRMPVIVGSEDYDRWLDTKFDPAALIRPYPADEIVIRQS